MAYIAILPAVSATPDVVISLDKTAITSGDLFSYTITVGTDYGWGGVEVRSPSDAILSNHYFFSGWPHGIYPYTWDSTGSPEGRYFVQIGAGESIEVQDDLISYFVIDNTPPVTTASAIGGSDNNQVTLSAYDVMSNSVESGIATINYNIDGGATQQYNGYSLTVTIPTGTHTLTYWSVDNAGNYEKENTADYTVQAIASPSAQAPRPSYTPVTIHEDPMSDTSVIYENGVIVKTLVGSNAVSPTPTTTPSITPTVVPSVTPVPSSAPTTTTPTQSPTITAAPSPSEASSTGSGMSVGLIIAVIAVIGVAAGAIYFLFVRKH